MVFESGSVAGPPARPTPTPLAPSDAEADDRPEPHWLGRRRQFGLLALGVLLLLGGVGLTLYNGSEPTAIVAGAIALIAFGLLGDLVDEVAVGPVTARRRRAALGDVAAEAQDADPAIRKAVERVADIAKARTPRQLDQASAAARVQLLELRAEEWVMELERQAGRTPRRAIPSRPDIDIASLPRRIRVRFVGGRPATGDDLRSSAQEREASATEGQPTASHRYVVEGTDPVDPSTWKLRVVPLADGSPDPDVSTEAELLTAFPAHAPADALAGPLRDQEARSSA